MKSSKFISVLLRFRYAVLTQETSHSLAGFLYRHDAEQFVAEQDYPHEYEIVEEDN